MALGFLRRLWPASLFGRMAVLLLVAVLSSHLLALTLLFEVLPRPEHWPPGPPPPSTATPLATAPSPPPPHHPAHPKPPVLPFTPGFLLDVGVRLGVLMLAAWLGARWLTAPIRQLAQAAQELGEDIQRPPLAESGTSECREATRVFNQMQQRIVAQIQERERFVAAMSHDLRTPLTRLRLRSEALPGSERAAMVRDVTEMETLLATTLDYLRGTSQPEGRQMVDMEALVQSLADDAQDVGQPVTVTGHAAPLPCQPMAVRRCLDNLVSNALRYGHTAHITLTDAPNQLVIEITDQGPGLPPEELDQVLQPFYRVDSSRHRDHGGIGLGLSIANDIAKRHGHPLAMSNPPSGGLCVRLTLPRHDRAF